MANGDFDNSNSGVLFKNDRKDKPSHPDYKGSIEADGREYWVSAWIKNKRGSNDKFLSLALTPKDDNRQQTRNTNTSRRSDAEDFLDQNRGKIDKHRQPAPQPQQPAPDYDSFDDDIPF